MGSTGIGLPPPLVAAALPWVLEPKFLRHCCLQHKRFHPLWCWHLAQGSVPCQQCSCSGKNGTKCWQAAGAHVLFVPYGEEYPFCSPFSEGRWGARQAELHLTQPKRPCPHILSPTPSVPTTKPSAAWKSLFQSQEPCCNPGLLPWGCTLFLQETPLVLPGRGLTTRVLLVLAASASTWPLLSPSLPVSSCCLCRLTVIYAMVCERKIGLADSTRNLIPALQTDSSQRQLWANVTATASAQSRATLT